MSNLNRAILQFDNPSDFSVFADNAVSDIGRIDFALGLPIPDSAAERPFGEGEWSLENWDAVSTPIDVYLHKDRLTIECYVYGGNGVKGFQGLSKKLQVSFLYEVTDKQLGLTYVARFENGTLASYEEKDSGSGWNEDLVDQTIDEVEAYIDKLHAIGYPADEELQYRHSDLLYRLDQMVGDPSDYWETRKDYEDFKVYCEKIIRLCEEDQNSVD